ncbi:hypothetical protein E3E36_09255 [Thermococcus sp. M36]|uniref:S8 family serine peptidase n=1 Tax=Thermococcus sp. M36 TaxID=1638261 RepID=UPI001439B7BE|nr:S8 family serine peptidase [Thermococcus sp. M36]NJE06326.1 hypothetical protein [Thermococcus sp. M36]
MNKKALSLLIAVVMLLSIIPAMLPAPVVSGASYSQAVPSSRVILKKVPSGSSPSTSEFQQVPGATVSQDLIDLIKELQKAKFDHEFWFPVRVVSQYPLENLKIGGVRVMGHARIGGVDVYILGIKISEDALRTVESISKIKGVIEISPMSDVEPLIETIREADAPGLDVSELIKALKEHNSPGLSSVYPAMARRPVQFDGKTLFDMKAVLPKFMTVPEVSPILKAKIGLGQKIRQNYPVPSPQDAYAVYNLGSADVWDKFNITGKGINVAVIDSGVDFGNPDLNDAYAVDTNPDSPYYGWPIAFDSASMMDYLMYDLVFPEAVPLFGIMPWYTNTSYITAVPYLMYAPYITGYQGDTFSTAFSGMSLANIPNATYRAYVIDSVLQFLFNGTPTGTILLVDDDDGPNNNGSMWYDFDQYYTEAFDLLGYNYTMYRVGVDGPRPNSTVLSNYSAVVWFTGMNEKPFYYYELENLSAYLDGGGRLFLISTNYLDTSGFEFPYAVDTLLYAPDVPAPPTGYYDLYQVQINSSVDELFVHTHSANESLDVDLLVFYNATVVNGTVVNGTLIGFSAYAGSNESVTIDSPMIGNYTIMVLSWYNPGNTTYTIHANTIKYYPPEPEEFTSDYLHISIDTLSTMNFGIPSVGQVGGETFRVSAINRGAVDLGLGYIGILYNYLVPSLTDFLADPVIPDANGTVISIGYMALPYSPDYGLLPFRLPLNTDLTLPFNYNSTLHIGLHPDFALAYINTPPDSYYLYPGMVLAVDSNGDNVTDKVYVDLTSEWGYFIDFNEDEGHTKDNPVVAWDIFQTEFVPYYGEVSFPGQDGYADISGGMIYYIADGETPIPYAQQVYDRWNLGAYGVNESKLVPEDGSLVAFMLGTVFAGGLEHGTLCAAAIAARGRTIGPAEFGLPGNFYPVVGNAYESKIIAEGDLYTWTANWIDMMYFATEGYDGVPGTGDEAQITSNSYGRGLYYSFDRGFSFPDRFLMNLTLERPGTVHFFAAANEGPGYATGPSEGASPGAITVGAATEWGYRIAVGWNAVDYYGDVVEFSSRGPNALGQPKPDVLATGMFGLGSTTLNMQAWRFWPVLGGKYANEVWSGTSLATPMAAGVGALVAQAFYQAHGRYPTTEEMRSILMSSAENVYNDVFQQGAGYLNATRAVELAMGIGGVLVSPNNWQAGSYEGKDHKAFPNVMYPGEKDTQEFTITNYNPEPTRVNITTGVLEKVGEVEIPVQNVNATNWPFVPISGYVPSGTDMMRVTVYSDTPMSGVDMLVRLYGDYGLIQQGGLGSVVSFTVKKPLERSEGLYLQVRQYGDATFNGTIKLEFYRIVPWKWVQVWPTSIDLDSKASMTFKATLTVPKDTPYGLYEGAIYVDYGTGTVTIPVSVIVASPSPSFAFGGGANSTGLYDNSYLYGTQGADYVKDARLYYFNVPEEDAKNGYILVDVNWTGVATVEPALLQPMVDAWSLEYPDVFGPYTLVDSARGDTLYIGVRGESVVMAKAVPGLNALWVYTPHSMVPVIPFQGRVDIAKLYPEQWVVVKEDSDETTFHLTVPDWIGDITATAYGFSAPIEYYGVTAPETGSSDYYTVNITDSPLLSIELKSDWDDMAGVDLDLYVYYNYNGSWILMGLSTTSTSDESVTIEYPMPGQYIIEVYSWSNPAPGAATYDLSITKVEGTELEVTNITPGEDGYTITAAYNLTETNMNATQPLMGMIIIGSDKFPIMFTVPVKLLPSPVDVRITSVETNGKNKVGETYNLTAYITNDGVLNATNVRVYLMKDGVPTELEAVIPVIGPGEVYSASFLVPIADTEQHKYTVVVETSDDINLDNNQKSVYIKAIDLTQFEESPEATPAEETTAQENVEIAESLGEAQITTTIETRRSYRVTVDGDHGTIVTVLMLLPPDTINYNIQVEDATLLGITEDRTPRALILYVKIRLHSPGDIKVTFISREDLMAITTINYVWNMLYNQYSSDFDKLYEKAVKMGVDNETLAKAMEYKKKAEEYYQQASVYLHGTQRFDQPSVMEILALQYLSTAYSSIYKATKLLQDAIKALESS